MNGIAPKMVALVFLDVYPRTAPTSPPTPVRMIASPPMMCMVARTNATKKEIKETRLIRPASFEFFDCSVIKVIVYYIIDCLSSIVF